MYLLNLDRTNRESQVTVTVIQHISHSYDQLSPFGSFSLQIPQLYLHEGTDSALGPFVQELPLEEASNVRSHDDQQSSVAGCDPLVPHDHSMFSQRLTLQVLLRPDVPCTASVLNFYLKSVELTAAWSLLHPFSLGVLLRSCSLNSFLDFRQYSNVCSQC